MYLCGTMPTSFHNASLFVEIKCRMESCFHHLRAMLPYVNFLSSLSFICFIIHKIEKIIAPTSRVIVRIKCSAVYKSSIWGLAYSKLSVNNRYKV